MLFTFHARQVLAREINDTFLKQDRWPSYSTRASCSSRFTQARCMLIKRIQKKTEKRGVRLSINQLMPANSTLARALLSTRLVLARNLKSTPLSSFKLCKGHQDTYTRPFTWTIFFKNLFFIINSVSDVQIFFISSTIISISNFC